jgi:Domain of unknown function (DUF222)
MSASDLGGASSPQGGMEFTWPSEVSIEDILAAAERRARYLAGEEIPGRRKRKSRGSGRRTSVPSDAVPPSADTGPPDSVAGTPLFDPAADDPQGEDAVAAAMSGAGSSVSLADLAGHALIDPGPALAGWLSCAPSADLDDAGLVTSITAWRKVTSWAQAQELTAVAELAERRGRGHQVASGQDRVQKLEAEFAPSEVALALTLTEGGAEYWMDLAVSMTRRLPATVAALRAGRIDLARAKLIETFTAGLDDELTGQVERRVLGNAEHQTTGQLRASLQRAVIVADPAAAERRREEAERNARVELSGDPEGTASLAGRFLPAGHAAAAWSRICAIAKALESSGAGGGIDLLRAQVFAGLLLGTLPIIPPPLDERGDDGPGDEGKPGSGGSPDDGDDPRDGGSGNSDSPGHGDSPERGDEPGDGDGPGHGDGPADGDGPGHGDEPQPRDEAPPDVDDRDKADGRDPVGDIRGADPPECRVRAGPAGSSWPEIPVPGSAPAPGCAPDWLGGIPPPGTVAGSTQARHDQAGMSTAGRKQAGRKQAGRKQAGRKQAGRSIPAGAMTLTVSLRTLAGLTGEPGHLGRLGAVTGEVARGLATAAAANPACEWKIIVVGTTGEAIAITRLDKRHKARCGIGLDESRGPGWVARIILTVSTADLATGALPGREELPGTVLGKLLNAAREAAAKTALAAARADLDASPAAGSSPAGCGHPGAVSSYRIPDSMRGLIEARDQTCRSPVCRQPAWRADMDHTIPYDLGGPTCRCNVSAECRHHHRLKQLKGWQLRQPQPGVLIWVTPARLTYTVEPDPYPA